MKASYIVFIGFVILALLQHDAYSELVDTNPYHRCKVEAWKEDGYSLDCTGVPFFRDAYVCEDPKLNISKDLTVLTMKSNSISYSATLVFL